MFLPFGRLLTKRRAQLIKYSMKHCQKINHRYVFKPSKCKQTFFLKRFTIHICINFHFNSLISCEHIQVCAGKINVTKLAVHDVLHNVVVLLSRVITVLRGFHRKGRRRTCRCFLSSFERFLLLRIIYISLLNVFASGLDRNILNCYIA